MDLIAIGPRDVVVVGTGHPPIAKIISTTWKEVRCVLVPGQDGADHALLNALGEYDLMLFSHVVFCSGDHIFAEAVTMVRNQGLQATVLSIGENTSHLLRETDAKMIALDGHPLARKIYPQVLLTPGVILIQDSLESAHKSTPKKKGNKKISSGADKKFWGSPLEYDSKVEAGEIDVLDASDFGEADSTVMRFKPLPEKRSPLELVAAYTRSNYRRICQGFKPKTILGNWYIENANGWLNFYRSETGYCIYSLHFVRKRKGFQIDESWVNRDPQQYSGIDIEYDQAVVRFLISRHLLNRKAAPPIRRDLL